jgi:hypothetical protein
MDCPKTYEVVQREDGEERAVGVVTLDAAGRLGFVSSSADAELRTIVDELNKEDVMHEDAAPPADAPRFAEATRPIKRGDERFVPALREHLRRYHGLELRPK